MIFQYKNSHNRFILPLRNILSRVKKTHTKLHTTKDNTNIPTKLRKKTEQL